MMLGGSYILCRKGVGSISPAPLAGCCMKLNLAPPLKYEAGPFFSTRRPGEQHGARECALSGLQHCRELAAQFREWMRSMKRLAQVRSTWPGNTSSLADGFKAEMAI